MFIPEKMFDFLCSFLLSTAVLIFAVKYGFSYSCRCMGIYMDTLNIFMRLVMILSGGGGGRRK